MAVRVLESIRSSVADGMPLERAVAKFKAQAVPEDLVENRIAEYLRWYEHAVDNGKRSPTSLREVKRYAAHDGHFSYWWGRPVHEIRISDIRSWHLWLAERPNARNTDKTISPKTQKNVSDAFRAFLRRLDEDEVIVHAPRFPEIEVPEYAPQTISMELQEQILDAIPWERRGAFLAAATEALRLSEVRAFNVDGWKDGKLNISHAVQGPRADARVHHTKNRSAEWREPWHPELLRWIGWRMTQLSGRAKLRGEVALFWNPKARNPAKRWTPDSMEREWHRACEEVGASIPFQEGTRHSTLTAMGSTMSDRMLMNFSRHRDAKSLGRYSKPKATKEAIIRSLPKSEKHRSK